MGPPKDITGQQFARLTVLGIDQSRPIGRGRHAFWICRCQCGATASIDGTKLRNGHTKSCGCLVAEHARRSAIKHHDCFSREYYSWEGMIQRCTNPKHHAFPRYGGRGIGVCERWLKSYANFLADMGRRATPKHSLERIDNSLGYSPKNCRWATTKEQANNRITNRLITYRSVTRTISEWSGVTGIERHTHLRQTRPLALDGRPSPWTRSKGRPYSAAN